MLWVPAAKSRARSVAVPEEFGVRELLAHPGKGGMEEAACDVGIALGCAMSVGSRVELLGCKRAGDLQPLFFFWYEKRGGGSLLQRVGPGTHPSSAEPALAERQHRFYEVCLVAERVLSYHRSLSRGQFICFYGDDGRIQSAACSRKVQSHARLAGEESGFY